MRFLYAGKGRMEENMRRVRENTDVLEYQGLAAEIRQANEEMQIMYQKLSFVTEPDLIDATIFQLNATQKRYEYLVGLIKQQHMVKK